jgi:hypothetical protein
VQLALAQTRATLARIVSTASTAPRTAGHVAFASATGKPPLPTTEGDEMRRFVIILQSIAAVAHATICLESQIVTYLTWEAGPVLFVGSSCLKCVQIQMLAAQVLLRKMADLF